MSTDLQPFYDGLVVRDEDTGAPIAVRMPGGGEVSLDDLPGLALWRRTIMDLERDGLWPVKDLVNDAIYQHLDRAGKYTLHTDDGLTVSGERKATWENAVEHDADALYLDLLILRQREGDTPAQAAAFADEVIKTERTLTAAGKKRLEGMSGAYAEAVKQHERPANRKREAPSVSRAK